MNYPSTKYKLNYLVVIQGRELEYNFKCWEFYFQRKIYVMNIFQDYSLNMMVNINK